MPRDALEERLFTDEEFSLFLDAAENDLVDEYVRGEMDFAQRRKFEEKYLISERRRERVRLAQILQTEVFDEKPLAITAPQVSVWQSWANLFHVPNLVWAGGLAVILLMLAFGGFWLFRQTENNQIAQSDDNQNVSNKPIKEVSPSVNENSSISNTAPNIELPANTSPENPKPAPVNKPTEKEPKPDQTPKPAPPQMPQQRQIFAFSLLPTLRSGESPILNIPPDAQTGCLRVVHRNQAEFIRYRVEIRNSDGDAVWSQEISVNKNKSSQPLTLNIESDTLKPATYELTLLGVTPDGQYEETNFYNFVVRRK